MTVFKANGSITTLLCAAFFFTVAYNTSFYHNVVARYPLDQNLAFLISLTVLLFSSIAFFLGLVVNKFTVKPVLIFLFLAAAVCAYFMNSYNVIIDASMLRNSLMTDSREVADLISARFIAYILLLGVVPGVIVYRMRLRCRSGKRELIGRMKYLGALLLVIVANLLLMSQEYTSFIREHKDLRYYMNPLTFVYSAGKFIDGVVAGSDTGERKVMGEDARVARVGSQRKLVVLVVGEATRADHWSLNGYERDTNAPVEDDAVISLPNVQSCATSTAYSLPCMFSALGFDDYNLSDANAQENLLDVLQRAGVNVLWRDNNSDSKGVAVAVPFEDFRSPDVNPVCDIECRDVGMLAGLDDYVQAHPEGDFVIVLHQMGNHGPAYYKRYPPEYERFTPVCKTNQIEQCTQEEIRNAYDNAVLYSNAFLSSVIDFLKQQDDFSTAMLYMADHGESLGEMGLYLHGLPYALAPEAQTHVASMLWFGKGFEQEGERVRAKAVQSLSHDNYFHTVLGMLNVDTGLHNPALDLVR
ncbi:MAG: phosphoethanolamine--lipid A transferase [Pseudomonadales bacterium]|nr:phosphoethanolamine--lipid A transferase [Pseudomonadales bacterium]